MPAVVLKLTDGTTTLDFAAATSYAPLSGAFRLSPLRLLRGQMESVPGGSDLGYDVRTITIPLNIIGSSIANLQTKIRDLEELLAQAKRRWDELQVNPSVTLVTLQYQLGTIASEDLSFDVIEAWGESPPHILDRTPVTTQFKAGYEQQPYNINLVVRPFAIGPEQSPAGDTLENHQSGGSLNYQDLTTIKGDFPSRFTLKLDTAPGDATSKTYWIAKRSGSRRTDTLFYQGESRTSFTSLETHASETCTEATVVDAATSGGNFSRITLTATGAHTPSIEMKGRWNFTLTGPPKGFFRVLVRVERNHLNWTVGDLGWAAGYSYGSVTFTPVTADLIESASNKMTILDLGIINIPPTSEPSGITLATYELRIFVGLTAATAMDLNDEGRWDLDYVFLLPVDEGAVILTHPNTDDIYLDSYSRRPGVYLLDAATGAMKSIPTYVGSAFDIGPEDTRIYILRNDEDIVTGTAVTTPKYKSRYVVV